MKFKKILSAALAAVMAASVMSVGMISSVSAAGETVTNTYTFGTDNASLETDNKAFFTVADGTDAADHRTIAKNGTITFNIPEDALNINITVSARAPENESDQTIKLDNSVASAKGGTVKAPGLGTEGTLKDPVDITWDAKNYAIGENTVHCTGGNIDYFKITVSYETGGATVAGLEPLAAGDYSTQEQFENVKNFKISDGALGTNGQLKLNNGQTVEFKVNDNATISVDYKSGSSDAGKTAYLTFDNGTITQQGDTVETNSTSGLSPSTTLTVENVSESVCKLTSTTSSTTAQITKITIAYGGSVEPEPEEPAGSIELATASANDKTYVIVGVDDPKAYENIQLYASNNTSDNTADSVTTNGKAVGELITTVYKAVTGIDPLPTSSQYVFAQEVVNGSGTYNFVAKSGDTTSDVVTITQGTTSSGSGYYPVKKDTYELNSNNVVNNDTYGGMRFTDISSIETNDIRVSSNSKIEFTVEQNCELYVKFASGDNRANGLTISDGESDTPISVTYNATVEQGPFALETGKTYTISGVNADHPSRLASLRFA